MKRLSKSQENNLLFDGNLKDSLNCIKFWESNKNVSIFLIKGWSIKSIKSEIREVGCNLQFIIGLRPNFSLWSLNKILNFPH